MNRLRLALEQLFQRNAKDGDDKSSEGERVRRELKGSIFSLLSLFELVALTSYLPIDSYNIFQGRLDHMNNLGGIVGAFVGELMMGTFGIMGYSAIAITLWLAVCSFRGISFGSIWYRLVGAIVATGLAAITFHLLFHDSFPDMSLFQGGYLGIYAGKFLEHYFNTTGALLLVGGGFLFTSILTIGFSVIRVAGSLLGITESEESEASEEADEEEETPKLKAVPANRPQVAAAPAQKPKRKSRKKKDEGENATGEPDPSNPDAVVGEDTAAAAEAPTASGEFTFKNLIPWEGTYAAPTTRLLKSMQSGSKRMSRGECKQKAMQICEHLLSFQITGDITAVTQGPVVTTYEFKPSAGVKLSKIAALQDDLGIVLGTSQLRIMAPIPGKTVVGIEVPRPGTEIISLKDVLGEKEFADKKMKIPFTLGKATDGVPVFADMAATPHLLVAGATGSGKSVFINSLIMSFIFRNTPQQLRLILVDPKMLELSIFDGIPHLITNVITDNTIAYNALSWAVMEMDRRYALMAETGSKNLESFNEKQKSSKDKLPLIVIVVDELADLMMSGGEAVETAITRLCQKARAAGIHLVIATQRPSTDVVTGLIKANIPSRLAFKVPSGIDSRTVLDSSGAEDLLGKGDSLMIRPGVPMQRLHGCFVTEEELNRVVKFAKAGKDHSKYYIDFSGGSIPKK